jgi:hypothetical protein
LQLASVAWPPYNAVWRRDWSPPALKEAVMLEAVEILGKWYVSGTLEEGDRFLRKSNLIRSNSDMEGGSQKLQIWKVH